MRIGPSLLASMLMTICACFALWRGEKDFSVNHQFESRFRKITKNLMEEKVKSDLMLARLNDFKQEVALLIPEQKNLDGNKSFRELASIIPHKNDGFKNEELKSKHLFSLGKSAFQAGLYDEAIQKFLDTVTKYPDSIAHLEASFYLIKTFYLTGNKQEALLWSEKMLKQFPESIWTAKSMLVMADIYKDQNRKNDALDIYQTVLNTFKDEIIQTEIKKNLHEMGI